MNLSAAMASALKAICGVTGIMTVGMALTKGIVVCGINILFERFLFPYFRSNVTGSNARFINSNVKITKSKNKTKLEILEIFKFVSRSITPAQLNSSLHQTEYMHNP